MTEWTSNSWDGFQRHLKVRPMTAALWNLYGRHRPFPFVLVCLYAARIR